MPKIVDHDVRRRQIVEAVWALIARRGLDAVTMRDLAAEAGYSNGALAPYFRNKDEILQAAFQYAFESTNTRAEQAIGDASGLTALRRLCLEIMPLDEVRLLEARVVIAFWDRALHDQRMADVHEQAMSLWRDQMRTYLRQAREAGEVTATTPDEPVIDTLLATLMGFQINALLAPHTTGARRQEAVLEGLLGTLA
ncbi:MULTISPECIES: TetR/AcrR family transcriptional regulator [unclassified Streptomyces]|uniref:TetR/AcrR family transcriptional regulator n=1 Tax=unclassified Streptomyces TaxID=2593676 RepID=UPI002E824A6A|nr:TetR/AcrR family transcriptional regulator [Streptomyces sp. NBC_00589]WTI34163.1 TetR/AcrR family transcriptional regulator [Streptomyces sp. NBC_00775]WUB32165.1 TetR/AcrR family transcriptional regulator [Streptomyces sp. NBC_00589]